MKRTEEYKKNKTIIDKRDSDPALNVTNKAFKNMTEKQRRAEERIKVIGATPDYFSDQKAKNIYNNSGITEGQKRELDIMNNGTPGTPGGDALDVLKNQINGVAPEQLDHETGPAMAKLIAAYEKDPKNSLKGLADVKRLLQGVGFMGGNSVNPDDYAGQVLLNYRDLNKDTMAVNSGKGELRTDAFAKNSVKDVLNRDEDKDAVGVSFGQMNARAKQMGVEFALEDNPDVQIGAGNTGKAALVMSSLIGDQINSIETAVNQKMSKILSTPKEDFAKENISEEDYKNANSVVSGQTKIAELQNRLDALESENPTTIVKISENETAKKAVRSEISQEQATVEAGTKAVKATVAGAENLDGLKAAQTRLKNNDLSNGLSLANTDIVYNGENDSEKRRVEYNGRQHEAIHKAGVTDEELTHESADALQSAQLIGKIPQSGGKRYANELGAMISNLETLKVDKGEIKKMIAEKINEWKVPNVQRVVETEKGDRDTETDIVEETAVPKEKKSFSSAENNSEDFNQAIEKLNKTVDVLNKSLTKINKVGSGAQPKKMSISDMNFFRSMFNGLKENNLSGDKAISEAMSPIEAMAINQENKKSV